MGASTVFDAEANYRRQAAITNEKARIKKAEDDANREAERLVQVAVDDLIHRRTMELVAVSAPTPNDLRTLTDDQFAEFLRPYQTAQVERKRVIAAASAALIELARNL